MVHDRELHLTQNGVTTFLPVSMNKKISLLYCPFTFFFSPFLRGEIKRENTFAFAFKRNWQNHNHQLYLKKYEKDRAERHNLKSRLWLFFSPFSSLLKKEGRRKGE